MSAHDTGGTAQAASDDPALTDAVVTGMHGGERPRVGARAVAGLVAVLVAAGAVVLIGMFASAGQQDGRQDGRQERPANPAQPATAQVGGSPAPSPPPAAAAPGGARPATPQARAAPTTGGAVPASLPADGAAGFTALSGVGCPQGVDRGLDVAGRDGSWVEGTTGGFYGYRCTGRYLSMPLSGTAADSGTRQQTWWFGTGALSRGSCHVYVFVPAAADARDTATTVHFSVLPARDATVVLGEFNVDEQSARDAWADAGWYTLRDATIAVRLTDRGAGRASAGAVLVKCQAG